MSQFDQETTVTRTGDGRWKGYVDGQWNIGANPNGGYLLSVAVRAMQEAHAHPDPLTVTTHYLRPGIPDAPCEIEVEVIRAGRTLSTVRSTLSQDGKARLEVLAAFTDLSRSAGVDASITVAAPRLPPADQCVQRSARDQGVELPLLDRLDTRLDPSCAVPGASDTAMIQGMIRFTDGRAPDVRSLLLFSDAFPPSPLALLGSIGWVPTLELTVHIRRRPAPGWITARLETDDLHEGRMVETGALWDSEGKLVAQSRQIGLVMDPG